MENPTFNETDVEATETHCRCMKCKGIADDAIDVSIAMAGGLLDGSWPVCASCKPGLLEGYARLQAAAQQLRDQDIPAEQVNRIMTERVDAGEFQ